MKPNVTSLKNPEPTVKHVAPAGLVSAEALFCGAKEIVIRHQGDDYRLRITRNDKLILTK